MQRSIRLELRRQIFADAERCGTLRGAALAMIDYVYSFSDPFEEEDAAYFEAKTEWVLAPDPWVAFRFTHDRKYVVHVSVGVTTLACRRANLPIKNGRFENWTRFSLTSPQQLPAAMLYLEEAYAESENDYRKYHGRPKKTA